jgi:hypothetical protein
MPRIDAPKQGASESGWYIGTRADRVYSTLMLAARITFAPFLRFIGNELPVVSGRALKSRASAQNGKPHLRLGVGKGGVDLLAADQPTLRL